MPVYAVDSGKQPMVATGIVNASFGWVDGARSDVQARDEVSGLPLWELEVMYKQTVFGSESTATAMVVVGAADRPVPEAFSSVVFRGLVVSVYVNRAKALVERWSAEGLADAKPAGSSSGRAAGSKDAA